MCNCSNFVGDTPFVNKPLNSFDGAGFFHSYANGGGILRDNCNGKPCESCSKSGSTTIYGADGNLIHSYLIGDVATPPTTETATDAPKRDWFGTLLPIVDKLVGVQRAPEQSSSFDTNPNASQEASSSKALWCVAGVIVALIVVFVVIKAMKKKK